MWSRSRTQADWEEYRVEPHRAQQVYGDAERAFTKWSKSLLTNAPNFRKWWSTVKTAVFGASSSLLPLVDRGSKLVWPEEEKAPLFSAQCDAKQCRDRFQQLMSLHRYCVLLSFGLGLFAVCSWIWLLVVEIIPMSTSLQAGSSGAGI